MTSLNEKAVVVASLDLISVRHELQFFMFFRQNFGGICHEAYCYY